jgi:hypothetical protein
MTKKGKKGRISDLEKAIRATRVIWGAKLHDPTAPITPPITMYIDPSHVLGVMVTSDIDKTALATANDMQPAETQAIADNFTKQPMFTEAKSIGVFSAMFLLDGLRYIVANDPSAVVEIKQKPGISPIIIEAELGEKRKVSFFTAPRVEDHEEFDDDDESEDVKEK